MMNTRCLVYALCVAQLGGACAGAAELLQYANNNNGLGSYSFEYEIDDGTFRREDGGLVPSAAGPGWVVRGSYGYVDPQGTPHEVHYVADENGFRVLDGDGSRFNDRRYL